MKLHSQLKLRNRSGSAVYYVRIRICEMFFVTGAPERSKSLWSGTGSRLWAASDHFPPAIERASGTNVLVRMRFWRGTGVISLPFLILANDTARQYYHLERPWSRVIHKITEPERNVISAITRTIAPKAPAKAIALESVPTIRSE